jgi:hypothetical protein
LRATRSPTKWGYLSIHKCSVFLSSMGCKKVGSSWIYLCSTHRLQI